MSAQIGSPVGGSQCLSISVSGLSVIWGALTSRRLLEPLGVQHSEFNPLLLHQDLCGLLLGCIAALHAIPLAWVCISTLSRHHHTDGDAGRSTGDGLDNRSLVRTNENRLVVDHHGNRHASSGMAGALEGLQGRAPHSMPVPW